MKPTATTLFLRKDKRPFVSGYKRGCTALKASGTSQECGVLLANPRVPYTATARMCIFAPKHVVVKSRFWYFMSQLRRMKNSSRENVYCVQVFKKSPLSCLWITLASGCGDLWHLADSLSGTHMYRKYWDLTTANTVLLQHGYLIMKVEEIVAGRCPWQAIKQFHDTKKKFPLPHHVLRCQRKPGFTTKSPNTFFQTQRPTEQKL